jgi:hypothetical protein
MRVKKESKQDLAKALHPKYLKAGAQTRGRMLDEFVEVTGYNRNYAKHCCCMVLLFQAAGLIGSLALAAMLVGDLLCTRAQLCRLSVWQPRPQGGYAVSVW